MVQKNVGRLCALFVCTLLGISGCASKSGWKESYESAMSNAQAKENIKDFQEAKESYLKATEVNPIRAEPWVRLAGIEFSRGNYGQAIVMASEALEREPSDTDSKQEVEAILVASGLRVTISGLERLHDDSGLQGTTKDDAKVLAEKIRAILGEDVVTLEVKALPTKKSRIPRRSAVSSKKAAVQRKIEPSQKQAEGAANYSNPFEFLPQN